MKYYKLNSEVYAFELDGSQDEYITENMIPMSNEDVDRHIHPEKYLADQQKYELYLASLTPLTRRQFKLALLENNMLTQVEEAISGIADPILKTRMQIEYQESVTFERTSDAVIQMVRLLGLTDDQINTMWQKALAL